MDDLEFRRRLLADPSLSDPELAAAVAADPARQRAADEAARLERGIRAALEVEVPQDLADRVLLRQAIAEHNDDVDRGAGQFEQRLRSAMKVDAPDGLEARILLRQGLAERRRRQTFWRSGLALAASVVVAAWTFLALWPSSQPLEASVIAHINHEINLLSQDGQVPDFMVKAVTQPSGVNVVGDLGTVRHASVCQMRRYPGSHLVLAGTQGPVTVLIMPQERVSEPMTITDDRFAGRIVPTVNGSMAIVGEQGEALDEIETRLRSSLVFAS